MTGRRGIAAGRRGARAGLLAGLAALLLLPGCFLREEALVGAEAAATPVRPGRYTVHVVGADGSLARKGDAAVPVARDGRHYRWSGYDITEGRADPQDRLGRALLVPLGNGFHLAQVENRDERAHFLLTLLRVRGDRVEIFHHADSALAARLYADWLGIDDPAFSAMITLTGHDTADRALLARIARDMPPETPPDLVLLRQGG